MFERIENPVVVDSLWRDREPEPPELEEAERLDGPGWEEIGTGVFVPEESAFNYALERCLEEPPELARKLKWTGEFREMLVEWYFSGGWVREE